MIPPCPTKSYPGIWELPLVMWNDLKVKYLQIIVFCLSAELKHPLKLFLFWAFVVCKYDSNKNNICFFVNIC